MTISEINEKNIALFLLDDLQLNFAKLRIHESNKTKTFHELFEETENDDKKLKIIMVLIKCFFMINGKIVKKLLINNHRLLDHLSNEEILKQLKEVVELEKIEVCFLDNALNLEDVLKY